MIHLQHPIPALATAALLAAALAAGRPARSYYRKRRLQHPLASIVKPQPYRRPRSILAVELALAAAIALTVASPYTVETKTVEVEGGVKAQLHIPPRPAVILVVDVSGSMAGAKLEEAKKALTRVVEKLSRLNTTVDIGLIAFNHAIQLAVPPTDNTSKLLNAIGKLEASGGTMYTYPLTLAYDWARIYREYNQTVVVIFATDGLPADTSQYPKVLHRLARLGVKLYGIFIGGNPKGRETVEKMARTCGGESYTAPTASQIVDAFAKAAAKAAEIVENVTVKAKPKIRVKIERSLTWATALAALALAIAATTARYRESRISV